jgi:hypothetical protein
MLKIENICPMSAYSIKTNMENWKKIQGFENYSVSDLGRVRRDTPGRGTQPGRFIVGGENNNGYKLVCLSKNGKNKTLFLHKLVADAFIPNPKNLPEVNHLNGKDDNSAISLEWCTHSENMEHAFRTGLKIPVRGENLGTSKLTSIEVLEIRNLRNQGWKYSELTEKFGIHKSTVAQIVNNKTWVHI